MITTTTIKNAAFAIEHDLFTDPDGANYLVKDGAILRRWEPEHDDGDALRLAVKLKLDIAIDDYVQVSWWSSSGNLQWVNEDCCRIAIVRAAAIIGESLKCQS